jgi:hypothetical protein
MKNLNTLSPAELVRYAPFIPPSAEVVAALVDALRQEIEREPLEADGPEQ